MAEFLTRDRDVIDPELVPELDKSGEGEVSSLQQEQTIWPDRLIATLLFFGVGVVYVAVLRGRIEVYDTGAMLDVTRNLVNHGSLQAINGGYFIASRWSPYGIAVSLLAVPAYWISLLIGHFGVVASLIAPILTAFCVVLIYRIARALNWGAFYGVVAGVGFGVLSMALWYTIELLSEPGVTLCELGIVLGMIRWRQGKRIAPLWIGLSAACAVQFRSDSIFTVWIALLAIPLFVPWKTIFRWRRLLLLVGPMALSLAFLAWYNVVRFNRLFVTSYNRARFTTPLLHGLDGLLISPGRGMFIYNPLTVAGVAGLLIVFVGPGRVRDRALGALCLLLIVPRILFFSKWGVWDGGSVWGPRFVLPVVALLSLMIVPLLRATDMRRISGAVVRFVVFLLAILGAGTSYLSARIPLGEWLSIIRSPYWRARFDIGGLLNTPTERGHALDFRFSTSMIWGYITLLRHHEAIASGDLWAYGHGNIGYTLLVSGALIVLTAAFGSRSRRRPDVVSAAEGIARLGT